MGVGDWLVGWISFPPGWVPLDSTVGGVWASCWGLLVSWFGGEVKKRLDKVGEKRKEIRVIRSKQKAALEQNVSELRNEGWEPKWESYRETVTGLLIRRIIYSVVMEQKPRKPESKALST